MVRGTYPEGMAVSLPSGSKGRNLLDVVEVPLDIVEVPLENV